MCVVYMNMHVHVLCMYVCKQCVQVCVCIVSKHRLVYTLLAESRWELCVQGRGVSLGPN